MSATVQINKQPSKQIKTVKEKGTLFLMVDSY